MMNVGMPCMSMRDPFMGHVHGGITTHRHFAVIQVGYPPQKVQVVFVGCLLVCAYHAVNRQQDEGLTLYVCTPYSDGIKRASSGSRCFVSHSRNADTGRCP